MIKLRGDVLQLILDHILTDPQLGFQAEPILFECMTNIVKIYGT